MTRSASSIAALALHPFPSASSKQGERTHRYTPINPVEPRTFKRYLNEQGSSSAHSDSAKASEREQANTVQTTTLSPAVFAPIRS
ncbi:hypothetical protein CcaverHIS002_0603780 [Cutaneotrichosporon cavernicola]|nr:hypothetical protein CcaverHIS002_0603780 [Cutaneotrichosporon cavernicola]